MTSLQGSISLRLVSGKSSIKPNFGGFILNWAEVRENQVGKEEKIAAFMRLAFLKRGYEA
jgi:hypothetical protein